LSIVRLDLDFYRLSILSTSNNQIIKHSNFIVYDDNVNRQYLKIPKEKDWATEG